MNSSPSASGAEEAEAHLCQRVAAAGRSSRREEAGAGRSFLAVADNSCRASAVGRSSRPAAVAVDNLCLPSAAEHLSPEAVAGSWCRAPAVGHLSRSAVAVRWLCPQAVLPDPDAGAV